MKEKQQLQQLMNRYLRVSTLVSYQFKIKEIIAAIDNMSYDLSKQQWYYWDLANYKKEKKEYNNNRKFKQNQNINKKLTKFVNEYLVKITELKTIIYQNKIITQEQIKKVNQLNLLMKELLINQEKVGQEWRYLNLLVNQYVALTKQWFANHANEAAIANNNPPAQPLDLAIANNTTPPAQPLDLSITNNNPPAQPLDLSITNSKTTEYCQQKINIVTINSQYFNDILQKNNKNTLTAQANIAKSSNSTYTNNFKDIAISLNHGFANNEETEIDPIKQVTNSKKTKITFF